MTKWIQNIYIYIYNYYSHSRADMPTFPHLGFVGFKAPSLLTPRFPLPSKKTLWLVSPKAYLLPDIQETWWIQVSDFKLFLLSRPRWPESLQGKQEQEERGAVTPRASTACSSSCELGGSAGPRGHQSLDRLLTGSCGCVDFVLQTHTTACVVL